MKIYSRTFVFHDYSGVKFTSTNSSTLFQECADREGKQKEQENKTPKDNSIQIQIHHVAQKNKYQE